MSESTQIDVGIKLNVKKWDGEKPPMILLHGLASNKETWGQVAEQLAEQGHYVLTVDQRGHGLSEKPDSSYSFDEMTDDLRRLIEVMGFEKPIIAGQSWGGNVVLAFGARFPGVARGLVFVDGGFLNLKVSPGGTWESVRERLRPPAMNGLTRASFSNFLRQHYPDWSEAGINATIDNLEEMLDGTLRRRLSMAHHMQILRAMWDQDVETLYTKVQDPVMIAVAYAESREQKRPLIDAAERKLPSTEVHWLEADHDIHIQKPDLLTRLMLDWQASLP